MLERAARPAKRSGSLLLEKQVLGFRHFDGRARRGTPVALPWGVGRGEPRLVREHPSSAPRGITVPNELTKESSWGGSAPPNGSRLSCGRNGRWRKAVGREKKRLAGEA